MTTRTRIFGLVGLAGVVLLALTAVALVLTQAASAPSGRGLSLPIELDATAPTSPTARSFDGEFEYPSRIRAGGSGSVRVELEDGHRQATAALPASGNRVQAVTPVALPLPPGVGMDDVLVSAEFQSGGFEVKPEQQRRQSLGRLPATWEWTLRPLGPGDHRFIAHIVAFWKAGNEEQSQDLWRASGERVITVEKESKGPITLGQISVTGVAGGVLTAFVIPWYFARRKEKKGAA